MALLPGNVSVLWGSRDPVEIPDIGALKSFTYSDDITEDNVVELVYVKSPIGAADRTELAPGQKLQVAWGRGDTLGDYVPMILEEPEVDYGEGVKLTLRAHDKGTDTKGFERHHVYPADQSLSDVIESKAEQWALNADVEVPDLQEFDRTQKRESDFRYLSRIADEIGVRFWIDRGTLHFRPDSQEPPLIRFVYRNGSLMKRFQVRTERQQQKNSQSKTEATGFDLENRSVVTGEATPDNDDDQQLSAGYVKFDAETGEFEEVVGRRIVTPKSNQAAVDAAAKGARKSKTRSQQVGSFSCPGVEILRAGVFIQIEGVAEIHAGLWRIRRSKHTINDNGYNVDLILDRETTGSTGQPGIENVPRQKVSGQEAAQSDEEVIINAETGEVLF